MRYITYPSSELVMRESLLLHSTNIVVYPNILLFMGFTLLYLIRSFRCSIFKVRFEWVSSILQEDWWAQVDSNHRPHAYQACALTT